MKKSMKKKLKLSRETVRQLGGQEVRWAVGGGITDAGFTDCTNDTTQTSANCPSAHFCGSATCGDTCGSGSVRVVCRQ
jgi:hypothetical protein